MNKVTIVGTTNSVGNLRTVHILHCSRHFSDQVLNFPLWQTYTQDNIQRAKSLTDVASSANEPHTHIYGLYQPSSHATLSPHRLTFTSPMCTSAQKRAAKTTTDDSKITIGPNPTDLNKDSKKESGVVYHGPISTTIKRVKLLSLSTCCLSVSLGPVITFMTSPEMNVILKGGVASTVIFLSASTTAALHWFVSPYVHKLTWKPGSETFEVEMMSWLATPLKKTIRFSDVKYPDTNRPYVSFKADGNYYFVDSDHCHDKKLLAMLTPQKPAHESAFKNL